ncbi:hypothetical protein AVEN_123947-1, partial [Araneus ventricosus]
MQPLPLHSYKICGEYGSIYHWPLLFRGDDSSGPVQPMGHAMISFCASQLIPTLQQVHVGKYTLCKLAPPHTSEAASESAFWKLQKLFACQFQQRGTHDHPDLNPCDFWLIYLGRNYSVILGDDKAVKAAFGKSTTTDRPDIAFDYVPDGVGFSSINGQEWIEQRQYCVRAMKHLGIGRDSWETHVQ